MALMARALARARCWAWLPALNSKTTTLCLAPVGDLVQGVDEGEHAVQAWHRAAGPSVPTWTSNQTSRSCCLARSQDLLLAGQRGDAGGRAAEVQRIADGLS